MQTKTFLVVLGAILTIVILGGIWFISNSITHQSHIQYQSAMNITLEQFNEQNNQSKIQYESQLNKTNSNFNRSVLIHNSLFDNITELKNGLDPIIDEISNATQMRIDEERHNAQAIIHFNQLDVMNQTINKILGVLNGTSGTNGTIVPIPVPVVNNITEENNKNQTGEGKGLVLQ